VSSPSIRWHTAACERSWCGELSAQNASCAAAARATAPGGALTGRLTGAPIRSASSAARTPRQRRDMRALGQRAADPHRRGSRPRPWRKCGAAAIPNCFRLGHRVSLYLKIFIVYLPLSVVSRAYQGVGGRSILFNAGNRSAAERRGSHVIAKINAWVTRIGAPCEIDTEREWFVHVLHCNGKILKWCDRTYSNIKTKCAHVEIEVPPGCYLVVATWSPGAGTNLGKPFDPYVGRARQLRRPCLRDAVSADIPFLRSLVPDRSERAYSTECAAQGGGSSCQGRR
jgi:hypothetical protein